MKYLYVNLLLVVTLHLNAYNLINRWLYNGENFEGITHWSVPDIVDTKLSTFFLELFRA